MLRQSIKEPDKLILPELQLYVERRRQAVSINYISSSTLSVHSTPLSMPLCLNLLFRMQGTGSVADHHLQRASLLRLKKLGLS